jgi:hypothetical protein
MDFLRNWHKTDSLVFHYKEFDTRDRHELMYDPPEYDPTVVFQGNHILGGGGKCDPFGRMDSK